MEAHAERSVRMAKFSYDRAQLLYEINHMEDRSILTTNISHEQPRHQGGQKHVGLGDSEDIFHEIVVLQGCEESSDALMLGEIDDLVIMFLRRQATLTMNKEEEFVRFFPCTGSDFLVAKYIEWMLSSVERLHHQQKRSRYNFKRHLRMTYQIDIDGIWGVERIELHKGRGMPWEGCFQVTNKSHACKFTFQGRNIWTECPLF